MDSWMVTDDVLFRIRVTLSSRKTAVHPFRTTAQVYSLEGTEQPEWKAMASGVPCTIKELDTATEESNFALKVVLADMQSGLSIWEEYVTSEANYYAYQGTFHTFKGKTGRRFGLQLSDASVAVTILEHMYDVSLELGRHEAATNGSDSSRSEDSPMSERNVKRKIKRVNTLSKKDISLPCNFVHISGVSKETSSATGSQEHLSSLLERKMKSLSAFIPSITGKKSGKKSSPASLRSSADITHERIFAGAMTSSSSQPSTPEMTKDRKTSAPAQRNTWNFGMLRKQSNGQMKEKPRKGLFRRNSFSGVSPSHSHTPSHHQQQQQDSRTGCNGSTEGVFTNGGGGQSSPQDQQQQRRSPTRIQPIAAEQSNHTPSGDKLQQRHSPSPPHLGSDDSRRYNTLPSSLRRAHSSASTLRPYVPRHLREYDTLAAAAPRQTMTRYSTEPTGVHHQTPSSTLPRNSGGAGGYRHNTLACSRSANCTASSSDLLLRRPVRTQNGTMREDEITAAAAATIARYTERMAKALQQFDDVLLHDSPPPPNPIANGTVVC